MPGHLCTLLINLYSIVSHRLTPYNTIEHTYVKILVSDLIAKCHEVTLLMKLIISVT